MGFIFLADASPVDVMACDQRGHLSACGRPMIGVKAGITSWAKLLRVMSPHRGSIKIRRVFIEASFQQKVETHKRVCLVHPCVLSAIDARFLRRSYFLAAWRHFFGSRCFVCVVVFGRFMMFGFMGNFGGFNCGRSGGCFCCGCSCWRGGHCRRIGKAVD